MPAMNYKTLATAMFECFDIPIMCQVDHLEPSDYPSELLRLWQELDDHVAVDCDGGVTLMYCETARVAQAVDVLLAILDMLIFTYRRSILPHSSSKTFNDGYSYLVGRLNQEVEDDAIHVLIAHSQIAIRGTGQLKQRLTKLARRAERVYIYASISNQLALRAYTACHFKPVWQNKGLVCMEYDFNVVDKVTKSISTVLQYEFSPSDLNQPSTKFPGWDSLNHMRIIAQIEHDLDLEFSFREIKDLQTVADLVYLCTLKLEC